MRSRTVVVAAYDRAELADIACVTSAFGLAGRFRAAEPYDVVVTSPTGADLCCSTGLVLRAQAAISEVEQCDTLIVAGGDGHTEAAEDQLLLRHVQRLARGARRVASVCTGATVLASAGLLDGHRATTHWFYADQLAQRYPTVRVDAGPVYIREGRISTSGGVIASLDLTLAFIEEDHGAEVARWVAMGMVTYLQRSGGQDQLSVFTTATRPNDTALREVIDYVLSKPDGDLRVPALADRVHLSPRQLSRIFHEQLGETPAAAVRRIRIELAARLLTTTDRSVADIARHCGFGTTESLRRAFQARYGASPHAYRDGQRTHDARRFLER
ncbi:GlxA family transcriptional regulator [Actinomadura alba]|uniref:Helix-turn-helix domain-containing protein n=1 Tax=Actinomadura alba TaxID=406431 RepID=A0ABR7LR32_9ACTN|nr:helix-turn-helix domain-containing protein [Actinomadura alba]MBC6467303.1 helix-turn-helix domain-containing protein [Actinomadura alba]